MDYSEIERKIRSSVKNMVHSRGGIEQRIEFSDGAIEILTQLVVNIEKDPSSFWQVNSYQSESAQRRSLKLVHEVLKEILQNYNFIKNVKGSGYVNISSWEILHGISRPLKSLCFIPKDI